MKRILLLILSVCITGNAKQCCVPGGHVSVSCWGFHPDDSTASLQAAFNCPASVVTIPRMSSPWVTLPLFLNQSSSNKTLLFEPGSVLLAKRGAYHKKSDMLIRAVEVRNLRIVGHGAEFRMWQKDYNDSRKYSHSEWRHGLSFYKSRDITVSGLTIKFTGGDGVYVSQVTNGLFESLTTDHAYRNGMSVIGAINVLVKDTIFRSTRGTWPQSGVDVEPNLATESLKNLTFLNCSSINNFAAGYQVSLHACKNESVDITFQDCTTEGDMHQEHATLPQHMLTSSDGDTSSHYLPLGFRIADDNPSCTGKVVIRNTVVRHFPGWGFALARPVSGYHVLVDGLSVINSGTKQGQPMYLGAARVRFATGNVDYKNLTVKEAKNAKAQPYMRVQGANVEKVTGTIVVDAPGKSACTPVLPKHHDGFDVKVICQPD